MPGCIRGLDTCGPDNKICALLGHFCQGSHPLPFPVVFQHLADPGRPPPPFYNPNTF